ncbi:armadillo-type protein [Mycena floridula]|nr:armadillo-type protein [Mycena floridula]
MLVERPSFIQLPSPLLNGELGFRSPGDIVLDSPEPMFYSAPSTPLAESPVESSPLQVPKQQWEMISTDDAFPSEAEIPADLDLDDHDGLTTLEKIYLFSRSRAIFHRVFIAHALPSFLHDVSPADAVEYVLPLLTALALDDDDTVKEAFVVELVPIIWWFLSNCQLVPDDTDTGPLLHEAPAISTDRFTPILGTLLLSPNPKISGPARETVVDLLQRVRRTDRLEDQDPSEPIFDPDIDLSPGLFSKAQRILFESDILSQVVIGMGRLDVEEEVDELEDFMTPAAGEDEEYFPQFPSPGFTNSSQGNFNPYFPVAVKGVLSRSSASFGSSGSSERSTPSSTTDTTASDSSSTGSFSPGQLSNPSATSQDKRLHEARADVTQSAETISQRPQATSQMLLDVFNESSREHLDEPVYLDPRLSPISLTNNPGAGSPPPTPEERSQWGRYSSDRQTSIPDMDVEMDDDLDPPETEVDQVMDSEQAAVGRLSSMSLVAAVAASGCLNEPTKQMFVEEVERVADDPVYWVRKEVCFAIGALAKVVPAEVVQVSLLPLLQKLLRDSLPEVRLSTLFALPAILSRLPSKKKRDIAREVLIPMSMDQSGEVRTRVLESLGEVIYTFYHAADSKEEDEGGGPPPELVNMFLGRRLDQFGRQLPPAEPPDIYELMKMELTESPILEPDATKALDLFYSEPNRPLICAFNFPAVALVLGPSRWRTELRETYLSLATHSAIRVKLTVAASVGEIARIIGPQNAETDLVPVWLQVLSHEAEEVRLRGVESMDLLVKVLDETARRTVVEGLLSAWEAKTLKSWRERELAAKSLSKFALLAHDSVEFLDLVRRLLRCVLSDAVSAVREAGIDALPAIWMTFKDHNLLDRLRSELSLLAKSSAYRKRMTFIACQQRLVLPEPSETPVMVADDDFWSSLAKLASDTVPGVRIGVSRLVGLVCTDLLKTGRQFSGKPLELVKQLSQDPSKDVQSYVLNLSLDGVSQKAPHTRALLRHPVSTFSRPPIPLVTLSMTSGHHQ